MICCLKKDYAPYILGLFQTYKHLKDQNKTYMDQGWVFATEEMKAKQNVTRVGSQQTEAMMCWPVLLFGSDWFLKERF